MMPLQPWANHLWQSTLFAAIAGLLTLALRKNRAQSRHWLWLAASVKFLIPFSLLADVGSHFGWHTAPPMAQSVLPFVIEQLSQPFAAPAPLPMMPAVTQPSSVSLIPAILYVVWAIGFATLAFSWWLRWRGFREALRTASPLDPPINQLPIDMEVRTSPAFAEPGVFGVRHPILLLPADIASHLTTPQLEAILAHELCHVRRRDNLAAAVHMTVEALFWFHPLVWWLGARLMEERERACDEEVLLLGAEPQAYAEGILKICEILGIPLTHQTPTCCGCSRPYFRRLRMVSPPVGGPERHGAVPECRSTTHGVLVSQGDTQMRDIPAIALAVRIRSDGGQSQAKNRGNYVQSRCTQTELRKEIRLGNCRTGRSSGACHCWHRQRASHPGSVDAGGGDEIRGGIRQAL